MFEITASKGRVPGWSGAATLECTTATAWPSSRAAPGGPSCPSSGGAPESVGQHPKRFGLLGRRTRSGGAVRHDGRPLVDGRVAVGLRDGDELHLPPNPAGGLLDVRAGPHHALHRPPAAGPGLPTARPLDRRRPRRQFFLLTTHQLQQLLAAQAAQFVAVHRASRLTEPRLTPRPACSRRP